MKKLLVLLTVIGVLAAASSASGSGAGSIVVSEVFAAGGNSGAPYTNDYVELFNRGSERRLDHGLDAPVRLRHGTIWTSTALSPAPFPPVATTSSSSHRVDRTEPRSPRPTPQARPTSRLRRQGSGRQRGRRSGRPRRLGLSHALRGQRCGACAHLDNGAGARGILLHRRRRQLLRLHGGHTEPAQLVRRSPAACSGSSGGGGGGGGTTGGGTVGVDLAAGDLAARSTTTRSNFGSVMPGTTPLRSPSTSR